MKKFCSQCAKTVQSEDGNCPSCGLRLNLNESEEGFVSRFSARQRPIVNLSSGDILISRFKIKKHIGFGRYSSVYLAEDYLQKKEVALKVVEVGPMKKDIADLQIQREMEVHNKISNYQYVIKIHDMYFAPWGATGLLLLSMEYANGGTFREFLLKLAEDLETRRLVGMKYFKQVCRGVCAVHEGKTVHRDLKPENMLFCGKVLKVSDFGSAKVAQQMTQTSTSTWEIPSIDEGTPVYMSPEHFNALHPNDIDTRADIYSLGIILFELLHPECRTPFGGSIDRIKELHLTTPAPKLPGNDENMTCIVARCLEKDPSNRYQTVLELLDDLNKGYTGGIKPERSPKHLKVPKTRSILDAIKNADISDVRAHLDNGESVNIVDSNGQNTLHRAIWYDNSDITLFLIKKGALLNAKDNEGNTPLHWAVKQGRDDQIKVLINEGSEINTKDNEGYTPLHNAIKFCDYEIADILIKKDASVNIKAKNGKTPIFEAAIRGNRDMVKLLRSSRADITEKDNNGWTPLHFAAYNGNIDIVILLATLGAHVDEKTPKGETALELAEARGFIKVTKILKRMLLFPFWPIPSEPPTLDIFEAIDEHWEMVSIVSQLIFGADPNTKNDEGCSPLHLFVLDRLEKKIVELFVRYGALIDAKDNDGRTPLHYAAWYGDDQYVPELIRNGANINIQDKFGETPLHILVREGCSNLVNLLLKKNAEVNCKDNDGRAPLHIAADNCREELIVNLIMNGANVNAQDNNGVTSLHVAAARGNCRTAEILLENGASADMADRMGNHPLEAAASCGHDDIINLLRAWGVSRIPYQRA